MIKGLTFDQLKERLSVLRVTKLGNKSNHYMAGLYWLQKLSSSDKWRRDREYRLYCQKLKEYIEREHAV